MSVEYHYQNAGRISGPVTFRNLVRKVRDGDLTVDDLVKPDWEEHWTPAAALVGLFHMAGRDDVLAKWEAEQQLKSDSLQLSAIPDSEISVQNSLYEQDTPPETDWGARAVELQEQELVQQRKDYQRRQDKREGEQSLSSPHSSARLANHISAATNAIDHRSKRHSPSRLARFFDKTQTLFHDEMLHRWFRWGSTFVVANVVGIEIVRRSIAQMQRFPQSGLQPSIPTSFPFWGECSPTLFFVLLLEAMLFAGIIGYWGARGLEQLVDE